MSVVKIPKPLGVADIRCCAKCGEAHKGAIIFDKGKGPYSICRRTIHSVPYAGSLNDLVSLPEGFEITDWVPQHGMIGIVADLTSVSGHRQLTIKRLEEKLADAAALSAPTPGAGPSAVQRACFTEYYDLPVQVRESSTTELEICDAKGYAICYFSGMESDRAAANFMAASMNAPAAAPAAGESQPLGGGGGWVPAAFKPCVYEDNRTDEVLLFVPTRAPNQATGYYSYDTRCWFTSEGNPIAPSHWQPLPQAPAAPTQPEPGKEVASGN
jgi:hypothetical protein